MNPRRSTRLKSGGLLGQILHDIMDHYGPERSCGVAVSAWSDWNSHRQHVRIIPGRGGGTHLCRRPRWWSLVLSAFPGERSAQLAERDRVRHRLGMADVRASDLQPGWDHLCGASRWHFAL